MFIGFVNLYTKVQKYTTLKVAFEQTLLKHRLSRWSMVEMKFRMAENNLYSIHILSISTRNGKLVRLKKIF